MVRFLPKEANLALLTGRCISIMHGFISKRNIQSIGVSFPVWSDNSIGDVIAFIHTDSAVLNELKQQNYFQNMEDCGFFKMSEIEVVPDECAELRFKRNQVIAKMFVGETRRRLKRIEKRALARGEVFNPKKATASRKLDVFHRIAMNSGSNQHDYILHIQRDIVDKQAEPIFNSYGFATNKQSNGTVPDLSSLVEKI
jgi:CRISPR-associated endonuclease Csy4